MYRESIARIPRRVLVAAYACHPDMGSESGVGWAWVREIAASHPVTLLTGASTNSRLEETISGEGLDVEVIRIRTGFEWLSRDSRLRLVRYLSWVNQAGRRVRELEDSGRFAVGHHITFASCWLPSPLSWLRATPYVWGPVGGATYPPAKLRKELAARGRFFELLRRCGCSVSGATLARKSAMRASLIVAGNRDARDATLRYGETIIETNAAFDYSSFPDVLAGKEEGEAAFRAVYAGRLLGWKGLSIAIKSLGDPAVAHWSLEIFGAGPERSRLERMVADYGLRDRVVFRGNVDREVLLKSLQSSSVFLFPSMHDSGSWAVAEASAMGLRVMCFPLGGSAELAGPNAILLDPANPVTSVIDALQAFEQGGVPYRRFDVGRIGNLCSGWYETAVRGRGERP